MTDMRYDRDVLLAVLVAHQRNSSHGCRCGWDILGRSHPEHMVSMYEQVMAGDIPACTRRAGCVLSAGHGGPCVQVLVR